MNDLTFTAAVMDSLTEATDKVQSLAKKADEIDTEIKSGKYNSEGLVELNEKALSLKRDIDAAKRTGMNAARSIVKAYVEEINKKDQLDPSEITDDVKLLTAGIPLLKRDIMGMLERNADNRTMTQIILRYAKEHNLDVGLSYADSSEHARNVGQYDAIISMYEKWMDKPNAYDMIKRFFGV